MKLTPYNKKRNFKKTPEPKGVLNKKAKHLFVIQKHAASHLHYDFRIELNGVLLSWAVPKGPSLDPTIKRLAMHVENHPVDYGSFEGIIPKGEYGGGTVMLWDKGIWIPEDDDPVAAYKKGHLHFSLKAKKLNGRYNLFKLKGMKNSKDNAWFLVKSNDKYAKSAKKYDITEKQPNSVKSNKNLDEIADAQQFEWSKNGLKKISTKKKIKQKIPVEKNLHAQIKINLPSSAFPQIIYPELATLADDVPVGAEWLHEIKLDGYRLIAFKQKSNIRLMSRNNRDWTTYFPNIVEALKKMPIQNIVLDGEVVLLNKHHRSDFQLLQNAIGAEEKKHFYYYIFDLLYYNHYNVMSLNLIERKNILKQILPLENHTLIYNDHIIGSGPEVIKNACKMSLEGIVSKKINSNYLEKRTKDWLKIKCTHRQEFVIGGFTPPQGARSHFGSLYLGYFNKDKLIFCGNVGTGFTQQSLDDIYNQLKKRIIKNNPFNIRPPGVTTAIWVRPELVADIEFSEWTNEGILRHPSFKGLRKDKPAKSIIKETEKNMRKLTSPVSKKPQLETKVELPIKLTNPHKILYQEGKITKLDLAEYYDEIQEWILPYLVNRPLAIVRCPENYTSCFFQKHVTQGTPKDIYGVSIKEKEKTEKTLYIKDRQGLLSLVQMGTLEIHPWGSRIEKVEFPDMITIDLDPAPDVSWKKVVITAKRIKELFATIHIKCFVKTTGGKGLHVVIPIKPEHKWLQIKDFTHSFVDYLVNEYPNEYIAQMTKSKRKGKIFVDYLRNSRGATSVAAYSTRARRGAPVSVPLDWDELTTSIRDTSYTIKTLPQRLQNLKEDPWREFSNTRQSIKLVKF